MHFLNSFFLPYFSVLDYFFIHEIHYSFDRHYDMWSMLQLRIKQRWKCDMKKKFYEEKILYIHNQWRFNLLCNVHKALWMTSTKKLNASSPKVLHLKYENLKSKRYQNMNDVRFWNYAIQMHVVDVKSTHSKTLLFTMQIVLMDLDIFNIYIYLWYYI